MTDKTTFHAGATLPELREPSSLDDAVAFITRFESALLTAIGFGARMPSAESTKHVWPEEALIADSTTVNGAQTNSDTAIEVATGTGTRFREGDVLQVDGSRELMSIDGGGVAASTLTVTRAIRGTTGAAIASGAVIRLINSPSAEEDNALAARPTTMTRADNYTEIFRDTASVSRSMRKAKNIANVQDQLDHQVMRVKQDLIRRIARTYVNGKRQSANPEGTVSAARTMDGILWLLLGSANAATLDAAGAELDEDLLNTLLETIWNKGGQPRLLAAPPKQRRKLSALMEGRQRFAGDDNVLGVVVERFVSDFGRLDVMEPDQYIPPDCLLLLDPSRVKALKLGDGGDPFEVDDLGKDGLVDDKQVVFEGTVELKNASDGGHGLLYGLATA